MYHSLSFLQGDSRENYRSKYKTSLSCLSLTKNILRKWMEIVLLNKKEVSNWVVEIILKRDAFGCLWSHKNSYFMWRLSGKKIIKFGTEVQKLRTANKIKILKFSINLPKFN